MSRRLALGPGGRARRGLLCLLAACALLAPLVACRAAPRPPAREEDTTEAPAAPPPLQHIVLANPSLGAAAPFFVAQDIGMFARHGLDVEVDLLSGIKSLEALTSRQAQYGLLSSRMVLDVDLAGGDLVMLAAITPTLAYTVFGGPDIGSVGELRGKAVGVSYVGAGADFAVRRALRRYDMEPDRDYRLVKTGSMSKSLEALEQGKVAAAVLAPPATGRARQAGYREVLDIAELGIDYVIGALTCTRGYLVAEPDTNRRFLKGMLEGIHYAKTNPTATKQIMARYLVTGDEDVLEDTYTTYVDKLLPRLPLVSLRSVELVLDELVAPLPPPAPPEQFVDNGPLAELEASGFIRKVWGE